MPILASLQARSESCELCKSTDNLDAFAVGPDAGSNSDRQILACGACRAQLQGEVSDANHWRCLNDSMWSPVAAVQVQSWRQLKKLAPTEMWAQELLDMMYLEPETEAWAKAGTGVAAAIVHKDCHGNVLSAGDSVTLIKDLPVKGANFTAKRGTAVRSISLVHDNADHIEGRVEGQRIVILTQYVKKN